MPRLTASMPCPNGCGGIAKVLWSRLSHDGRYRTRRRKCEDCGARQTTSERYIGPVASGRHVCKPSAGKT